MLGFVGWLAPAAMLASFSFAVEFPMAVTGSASCSTTLAATFRARADYSGRLALVRCQAAKMIPFGREK